jgi:hypothetical protein
MLRRIYFWGSGVFQPNISETDTAPIRIFTVGLGNRKGTNAMIRSERVVAGINVVSIIASLGYIALVLIG